METGSRVQKVEDNFLWGGWTTNPSKEVVIKTWWQLPKTTLVFWPFWPFFATKRQHLVFCHFLHNTQLRLKILIILRQIQPFWGLKSFFFGEFSFYFAIFGIFSHYCGVCHFWTIYMPAHMYSKFLPVFIEPTLYPKRLHLTGGGRLLDKAGRWMGEG